MVDPNYHKRGSTTLRVGGPDLEGHFPAFDQAFGKFIRLFGRTETVLAVALESFCARALDRRVLGIDILRALIGSRRTPELAVATKLALQAVMRADDKYTQEDFDELTEIYRQVSEIRFFRDRTAHYSIVPELLDAELYFRVLNRWTVNDLDKAELIYFRILDLERAAADLQVVCDHIAGPLHMGRPKDDPRWIPRPAWQYKPNELIRRPNA